MRLTDASVAIRPRSAWKRSTSASSWRIAMRAC